MGLKNTQLPGDRIVKHNASLQSGSLQHVVAAHAKLKKLQAWRRQQKIDYALCIDERDKALRAVKKLEFYADEISDELEHAKRLIDTQAQLIEELRGECGAVTKNSKRPVRAKIINSDGPALTVRAVKKISEQKDNNTHAASAVRTKLSSGPVASLFRRIGRRRSPG